MYSIITLATVICASLCVAQIHDQTKSTTGILTNDHFQSISNSLLKFQMGNNGQTSDRYGDALIFPKESKKSLVWTDGIVWSGLVNGQLRVGGATYRSGLQAGSIRVDGTPSNPNEPRNRVYRVRRLSQWDSETFSTGDIAVYTRDFYEWPVHDGAPWIDANHNGRYDPNLTSWLVDPASSDSPFFIGDEMMWYTANDLDASRVANLYGTSPIGLEVRVLAWVYDMNNSIGHTVFRKFIIINRGMERLDSVYISLWTDPEIGDSGDDYVGVDTSLQMGYAYNGLAVDGLYGSVVPALGYRLLQGPIVPSPGSTARFAFSTRKDYRNLPLSSFLFIVNSSAIYGDPGFGDSMGMRYHQMGRTLRGTPIIDPTTGNETLFPFSGDPVTRKGWTNQGFTNCQRMMMSTGPFQLAVGDTQEIVIATIIGLGWDYLSSVTTLRYHASYIKTFCEHDYNFPRLIDVMPKAHGYPGKVILDWGNPVSSQSIESSVYGKYRFQGYNVYESVDGIEHRIATFDVKDNIDIVYDAVIDDTWKTVVRKSVQFGSNSGITRSMIITRDAHDQVLWDHREYSFGVSTYYVSDDPAAIPLQIESPPVFVKARPQGTNPGVRLNHTVGDTMSARHIQGSSTGSVQVEILDPKSLTGNSYEVRFQRRRDVQVFYDHDGNGEPDTVLTQPDHGRWLLNDLTMNRSMFLSDDLRGMEEGAYSADGFRVAVRGAGYYEQGKEILKHEWIGRDEIFTPVEDYAWMPGYDFIGSSIPGYEVKKTIEIRLDSNAPSKGYLYVRSGVPNFAYAGYYDSPASVWDVTDPKAHRQLSYAFVEELHSSSNDSSWLPGEASGREYFFVLDEHYRNDPDPRYTRMRLLADIDSFPILYAGWYERTAVGKFENGDLWRITPNVPFTQNDRYTFTTTASVITKETQREDVNRIQVYPNPYLASRFHSHRWFHQPVTITNLPERAVIRILTITGVVVRSIEKHDASQYAYWDLLNHDGFQVSSGMYLIHVELPDIGEERILKLAVVSEQMYHDPLGFVFWYQ